MSLLTVKGVSKSFGKLEILKQVDLDVQPEERHVIIGPNGAGKTTLFNCITGVLPIDAGQVVMDGHDLTSLPPYQRAKHGLSRTFQKNNLFLELTVEKNVALAVLSRKGYRHNMFRPLESYSDVFEEAHQLLDEWGLLDRKDLLVNQLSYGEQRLLEILLALALKPRLLLLDEPTSGMSPAETQQTIQFIQRLPRSVALLVVEHDMDVVFAIADRITVLHHGQVFASGTPEEVKGNAQVTEIYFGGGALKDA